MRRTLFRTAIAMTLALGLLWSHVANHHADVEGAELRLTQEASAAFIIQNIDSDTAEKSVLAFMWSDTLSESASINSGIEPE